MRKELFLILAGIILISVIVWWNYDSNVDVNIKEIIAPKTLGVDTLKSDSLNQVIVVVQNNEPRPVEIKLETDNAFVDENGKSRDTYIVFGYDGLTYSDIVSTRDKIALQPGENRLTLLMGYKVTGEQDVHIKIINNEILLDDESFTVEVLPPENTVELTYKKSTDGNLEIYEINAYVLNNGQGRAENVEANLSIIDPKTNKTISSETVYLDVPAYSKSSFSTWKGHAAGIIELSSGNNSVERYMPVQVVAKGKVGDQYLVKLTAKWHEENVETEILIPEEPDEKGENNE
ncbi:hypothetical protein V7O62_03365 [Methanolobus sp. ZRKC2]|uniref:hypothetical protein n=1 Tax=Methanolobus sp. ZRKC2 TaxID=3125783 RepID=UPI0032453C09